MISVLVFLLRTYLNLWQEKARGKKKPLLASSSDSDSSGDDKLVTSLLNTIITASMMEMEQSGDSSDSTIIWGGSRKGKLRNVHRDLAGAYSMVVRHYFSGIDSLYTEKAI